MKKLAATIVFALLALGLSAPAFARDRWDRRHRDWREERHYRPYYPYYRPSPQIIIPLPFPILPPVYTPYPAYPTCQQVWIQPQWAWDVLSNRWFLDPGHWQTVCQ